jgi:hypothetical protein
LVGLAFSPVKFKVPPIEGTKSDFYQLSLEEIDELFASIVLLDWSLYTIKLTIGGVHHAVSAGTRAYRRQNLHRVW